MKVFEVHSYSYSDYGKLSLKPLLAFDRLSFNVLNEAKCREVICLAAGEKGKERFGLIGGIGEDGVVRLPFSAPFGMLSSTKKNSSIKNWHEGVVAFVEFLRGNIGCTGIQITPPPAFYAPDAIAFIENALITIGFSISMLDINYHFDLAQFDEETYQDQIDIKARQKLRAALREPYELRVASTVAERNLAYEVIRQNREYRGYPLRLTAEDIERTSAIIDIDYLYLLRSGSPIASAIVYHVCDDIVQVVYWGNVPDSEEYKPMNYLAFVLFGRYQKLGKRIIDVGISTDHGIPNFGLCEFKTSIGCMATLKPTFVLH